MARPMRGSCRAPSQPVWPVRVAGDPRADGLDDQDVRQPRDHRLAARPQLPPLGGDEPERAVHPLVLGRRRPRRPLDDDRAGQQRHQVAGRRVPEADGAAHDARGRPTAAVAQDRVAVAGVVVLEPIDPWRPMPRARCAAGGLRRGAPARSRRVAAGGARRRPPRSSSARRSRRGTTSTRTRAAVPAPTERSARTGNRRCPTCAGRAAPRRADRAWSTDPRLASPQSVAWDSERPRTWTNGHE